MSASKRNDPATAEQTVAEQKAEALEKEQIEESLPLQAKTVYEVIRQEGEEELTRPVMALWWSGVAAGLAISSSLWAYGLLAAKLPDENWSDLIAAFGYTLGFVIVILGRMQLFTENTITPILPLFADFTTKTFKLTARLWGIVLLANFSGSFVAALFAYTSGFAGEAEMAAFYEISRHLALDKSFMQILLHGIPAGFYVAALVWMLPSSKGFELSVIVLMTYLIAIGGFSHVIVGSTEVFLLWLDGQIGLFYGLLGVLLPALIGNVLGGTVLFSILAYRQVRNEID